MSLESNEQEREQRKRAIFESMGKRGQQHVLKLGYENWDPFQEPKDPRDEIRSRSALQAALVIQEFYEAHSDDERVRSYHKDLLDLCRGLLRQDLKARSIYEFCLWYGTTDHGQVPPTGGGA